MALIVELWPSLTAMAVLIALSAFFSASEAALFSLRWADRRHLEDGSPGQKVAAALLGDPDRLLSAVLFWNLVINMTYFAIVSRAGIYLQGSRAWLAGAFATASLLAIIFFSEMAPKSVGVLCARQLAGWIALPLALAVRLVDPLIPLLRYVNLLSRRLVWPGFEPERLLDTSDLERAINLSHADDHLAHGEREALGNILLLSEILVEEWMRPRAQFRAFRPPVRFSDLEGEMTPSGYLLVTDEEGDDVVAALDLGQLYHIPHGPLEQLARPVAYAPWCATVADALQAMQDRSALVTAVVNEFGETIGILSMEDVIDTIFTYSPSRSKLLLDAKPIHDLGPNRWLVAGVTGVRQLSRYLARELPGSKSVTVQGAVQDTLRRLAQAGDTGQWGPFDFQVLEAPQRGHMLVELHLARPEEDDRS